jgi:hypothetical protein
LVRFASFTSEEWHTIAYDARARQSEPVSRLSVHVVMGFAFLADDIVAILDLPLAADLYLDMIGQVGACGLQQQLLGVMRPPGAGSFWTGPISRGAGLVDLLDRWQHIREGEGQ